MKSTKEDIAALVKRMVLTGEDIEKLAKSSRAELGALPGALPGAKPRYEQKPLCTCIARQVTLLLQALAGMQMRALLPACLSCECLQPNVARTSIKEYMLSASSSSWSDFVGAQARQAGHG